MSDFSDLEGLFDHAARVGALLKERGETIAIAESSTGGLISATLLAVAGASAYYRGGGVIYTGFARNGLMGLPKDLTGMRPATEEYGLVLADTVREKLDATWGLGESGATGPTGNRYGDAAGHTVIGVSGPKRLARTVETGDPDRRDNMVRFANAAFDVLTEALQA